MERPAVGGESAIGIRWERDLPDLMRSKTINYETVLAMARYLPPGKPGQVAAPIDSLCAGALDQFAMGSQYRSGAA